MIEQVFAIFLPTGKLYGFRYKESDAQAMCHEKPKLYFKELVERDALKKAQARENRLFDGREEQMAALDERIEMLEAALQESIDTIKIFHGPATWDIYRDKSPEMIRWRQLLAGNTTPNARFPENAVICGACSNRAVINLEGRMHCLSCGKSETVEDSDAG